MSVPLNTYNVSNNIDFEGGENRTENGFSRSFNSFELRLAKNVELVKLNCLLLFFFAITT